jgi:hypothetical protein
VVIPWSKLEIHDRHFNGKNGFPPHPAYLEVVDFLPGLAGESRTFDANGPYVRLLGNGGTFTYSLQPGRFGSALTKINGVQPDPPPHDRRPPLKEKVPCETQPAIKTLNNAGEGPSPKQMSTASTPATKALSKSISTVFNYELDRELQQQGSNLRVKGTHLPAKQQNASQQSTTSSGSSGR